VDYGSDLDVVLIYDEDAPPPVASLTHAEGYQRLAELFVTALSSMTREGYLYRVDLRLRPDGRNGPLASGRRAFLDYLAHRAAVWEWLAYVKLRSADYGLRLDWARGLEHEAQRVIHTAAQRLPREQLRDETRRVRERLEAEKGRARAGEIDIKHGAGGLLDVYFAVRYLQLRDNVPDMGAERSTTATLDRLRDAGSLREEQYEALRGGYEFLRALDHRLRLAQGKTARLPGAEHGLWQDLARGLGAESAARLRAETIAQMTGLRAVYEVILN
jgi:glutamate-ammonia-ligase adenylyltransferase